MRKTSRRCSIELRGSVNARGWRESVAFERHKSKCHLRNIRIPAPWSDLRVGNRSGMPGALETARHRARVYRARALMMLYWDLVNMRALKCNRDAETAVAKCTAQLRQTGSDCAFAAIESLNDSGSARARAHWDCIDDDPCSAETRPFLRLSSVDRKPFVTPSPRAQASWCTTAGNHQGSHCCRMYASAQQNAARRRAASDCPTTVGFGLIDARGHTTMPWTPRETR